MKPEIPFKHHHFGQSILNLEGLCFHQLSQINWHFSRWLFSHSQWWVKHVLSTTGTKCDYPVHDGNINLSTLNFSWQGVCNQCNPTLVTPRAMGPWEWYQFSFVNLQASSVKFFSVSFKTNNQGAFTNLLPKLIIDNLSISAPHSKKPCASQDQQNDWKNWSTFWWT